MIATTTGRHASPIDAAPAIQVDGQNLRVHFSRFDIDSYRLFLRVKKLPEYTVDFSAIDESYTITAPARFAPMLGVELPPVTRGSLPYPKFLFDDQTAILDIALPAKRFACWSGCGQGKTLIQLEWSRQVAHRTGGKVLGFTLNEIVGQTVEEAARFYPGMELLRLASREQMKAWAADMDPASPRLAITNYEKMNHGADDQVVNELRHLAGVWLDESDRLKGGGGKQKWALIKSCRGIEYKLSCTATPAPNDTIEFASQASFLEKIRSDADIIWTYFHRDPKSHRWAVKRHARKAFFEFMSAWSIYVRDPRRYGWRLSQPDIPEPIIIRHTLAPTAEQIAALQELSIEPTGQGVLFQARDTNAIQSSKLSQLAKGFYYAKGGGKSGRKVKLVASPKPAFVADLARSEAAAGLQVLIWTVFDAESDLIAKHLAGMDGVDLLTGKTADDNRIEILERFRSGASRVLISRASMLGYGMNFQCCGSMIFSGWSYSYVQWYQAIRRAYRYGQLKRLRVHVPVIDELEGDMLAAIFDKSDRNDADIAEMEENYIAAYGRLRGCA